MPSVGILAHPILAWTLFFVYCMLGWVVESSYCSLLARRFVNRGFLNGPYIPIYGCGAMIGVLFLSGLPNLWAVFVAGGLASCALEYVTSWAMERAYHARWWDYSKYPLNLNGRIWAGGFVEFGMCSVAVVLANPHIQGAIQGLPQPLLQLVAMASLTVFSADVAITMSGMAGLRQKMDYLREESLARLLALRDGLPDLPTLSVPNLEELVVGRIRTSLGGAVARMQASAHERIPLPGLPSLDDLAESFSSALSVQERRVLRAFPKMRPSNYRKRLEELRERLGR